MPREPASRVSQEPGHRLRDHPWRDALALGAAAGALEVALRADPARGWTPTDTLRVLGTAIGLASLVSVLATACALAVLRRSPTRAAALPWASAALLAVLAATVWRDTFAVNAFLREPRAWGGILAFGATGGLIGVWVGTWLTPRRASLALAILALGATPVALARARTPQRPLDPGASNRETPSFLVVTLDTVRRDRLPVYGHDLALPHLEGLASEGLVFDDAVAAAPITAPSHHAMFTGQTPLESGVVSNGTSLGDPPLLWRALRARGYATAGFVSGYPLHGTWGWGEGFDVFDDDFGRVAGIQSLTLVKAWNQLALRAHTLRERGADRTLARAVPWLERHRSAPTFTWVHLYDAHGPYTSPRNATLGAPPRSGTPLDLPAFWPPDQRAITSAAWLAMAYENELRDLDEALGRLLAALGPARAHTVVVVTSDHGESLGDHDEWFDHGSTLYDEVLRVPLVMRLPDGGRTGARIPCQVGLVDLAPTMLTLAGAPSGTEGFAPLLRGDPCPQQAEVVAATVGKRLVANPPVDRALRVRNARGAAKLIVRGDGRTERYDLDTDPLERANRAPDTLSGEMNERLPSLGTRARSPETDADTREALEALGYVDP